MNDQVKTERPNEVHISPSETKKKWTIVISQNGWEFSGWITVTAFHVEKSGHKSVIADGMEIEFDEEIGDIDSSP